MPNNGRQPGGLNRAARRAALGAHPRPASDLIVTAIPGVEAVFVGLRGGGHVRLDHGQAVELADQILELAGGRPSSESMGDGPGAT